MRSIRIGCAVGVAVWLVVWPYSFFGILTELMDGCYLEGICGEHDGVVFWTAMLGAPLTGAAAGFLAGWGTYALIDRWDRRKA